MKTYPENDLLNALNWRYAVKKFDTKKISSATWQALESSLILTPSSYGLQPWKFCVITNPELREKLVPNSWGQRQIADASHLVVFAALKSVSKEYVANFIDVTAKERNIPRESVSGYEKMIVGDVVEGARSKFVDQWAARQCYIALGNFMTTAAVLGIDTCPLEGIDPVKYDEILDLGATGYQTVVACVAGYRHAEDKYAQAKKVRFSAQEMIRRYE